MVVGESISRVRNVLKAVKEDPFMTDRFLYSLIMKFAKTLIKREELASTIYKYTSLFKEIPCLELIDVDKVDECCAGIKTGCTIKRSKNKGAPPRTHKYGNSSYAALGETRHRSVPNLIHA